MNPTAWGAKVAVAWFFTVWAALCALGWWLLVDQGFVIGDAVSRVGNAWATTSSRDPHLSAIGFVFSPLNTISLIPLLPLRPLVPELVTYGYAAVVVAAAFMSGAVIELFRIVREHTRNGAVALLAAVLFLGNPVVLLYGANGMSEAAFLFFGLRATRGLARWARHDNTDGLVIAGVALAFAYLVRYEAAIVGAAAASVVFATRVVRDRRRMTPGLNRALTDALLVALPLGLAFVGWALASWLVTGEPFVQFSGTYGNSAIAAAEGVNGVGPVQLARQTFGMTPLLVPVLALAAYVAVQRPMRALPFALVVPCLASLAFSWVSIHGGTTFDFLRYLLIAVPVAMLAATTLPRPAIALTLVGVVAIPAAWATLTDPDLGVQEHPVRSIVAGHPVDDGDAQHLAEFHTERRLAQYIDGLHLPDGSVIVDTSSAFAVVLASNHPKQFVIPSDRDFNRILDQPFTSGVRYALTVPAIRRGRDDALNKRYPGIYGSGGEVAVPVLAAQNDGPDLDLKFVRIVRDPE